MAQSPLSIASGSGPFQVKKKQVEGLDFASRAQKQYQDNKKEGLTQIAKDLLGREPGEQFLEHFGEDYDRMVSAFGGSENPISHEDALAKIAKDVGVSGEARYFAADVPDWFQYDPTGGSAPGHMGHEWDYQGNLDPAYLTELNKTLNPLYGFYEGRTVDREGTEYFGEEIKDNVNYLIQNEGYSFPDALNAAMDQADLVFTGNINHQMHARTGNIGPGAPNYITDAEGNQTPIYFTHDFNHPDYPSTLGMTPSDPSQNPFYDDSLAAMGIYTGPYNNPIEWDVKNNPNYPGGSEAVAASPAALELRQSPRSVEVISPLGTGKVVDLNPFDIPNILKENEIQFQNINVNDGGYTKNLGPVAGGQITNPHGLLIDSTAAKAPGYGDIPGGPSYQELIKTGGLTAPQTLMDAGPLGTTATFFQNPHGTGSDLLVGDIDSPAFTGIDPNTGEEITTDDPNALNLLDNLSIDINQEPFDMDAFKKANFLGEYARPYQADPPPDDGGGDGGGDDTDPPGPGDPPPGWYEREGFETVRFKTEDAFGISPNVVYQGQGGGNTTVINQAPPKNKTAAVQMLRENVRNNAAGVQRRNYNYAKSRGTQSSIPGTGGSLNIPGVG
jgi:hypothetical protein